jgi:hypothetical protein
MFPVELGADNVFCYSVEVKRSFIIYSSDLTYSVEVKRCRNRNVETTAFPQSVGATPTAQAMFSFSLGISS